MGNIAMSIDQQISLLVERGMLVENKTYAQRILGELGYYHLGFYWYAFEDATNAERRFKASTTFEDVVRLYEFEFSLKQTLLKYLRRIEISLRTKMIYRLSLAYPQNARWFADPEVVEQEFIRKFDKMVYTNRFKQDNMMIKKHHAKHADKYAPAWKTLEYMTFGQIIKLYCALKKEKDQLAISQYFAVNNPKTFTTYLWAIKETRNRCAHSNVLYDMNLHESIRKGPAGKMNNEDKYKISGVMLVMDYLVGQMEGQLQRDFRDEIYDLLDGCRTYSNLSSIMNSIIGGQDLTNFFGGMENSKYFCIGNSANA